MALAINPQTPDTLYAGTYGGGVFKIQQKPSYSTIYVSKDGLCSGNNPCFRNIQKGIASASDPTAIKISQETSSVPTL